MYRHDPFEQCPVIGGDPHLLESSKSGEEYAGLSPKAKKVVRAAHTKPDLKYFGRKEIFSVN